MIPKLFDILKERNFIKTAVRTESKAARDAMEFLIEFWDYEKSPYIRELHLRGKSFHKKQQVEFLLHTVMQILNFGVLFLRFFRYS